MIAKHVYILLRRKKDNAEPLPQLCRKYIAEGNPFEQMDQLRKITQLEPGVWRIYRTVNKRNFDKARELLMIKLIQDPNDYTDKIGTLWKSIMMKPECKAEKKWLLDIDTKEEAKVTKVFDFLKEKDVKIHRVDETPNGWHLVTDGFDCRELHLDELEIKKDGLLFMELVNAPKV